VIVPATRATIMAPGRPPALGRAGRAASSTIRARTLHLADTQTTHRNQTDPQGNYAALH
jgi:hypothetical protein